MRDRNLCRKVEVPLTIEQHERIKKLAEEGGISQGQVVRLLMNAGELAAQAAKRQQEKPAETPLPSEPVDAVTGD